jgi:hypothetical protein
MPNQYTYESTAARFWAKVDANGECWEWQGATDRRGYGQIGINGKLQIATHAAWELVAGPLPKGLWVLHTCDNPACVRNDDEGTYEVNGILHPRRGHLWLGTHQDNMDDMVAKGRWGERDNAYLRGDQHYARRQPELVMRGEKNGHARLTEADVLTIRERHARGDVTQRQLAREYSVSFSTINVIVNRKQWRHIP